MEGRGRNSEAGGGRSGPRRRGGRAGSLLGRSERDWGFSWFQWKVEEETEKLAEGRAQGEEERASAAWRASSGEESRDWGGRNSASAKTRQAFRSPIQAALSYGIEQGM
ncbi:unnamed protein product [Linum trigynum]|uniref:Uncharacterized protein n=1 Tax=Linum trigynum TaxID=586398 RepID=A0AAV2F5T7_9ROSI